MRGAFGKPQGTVARVHIGQPIMSVRSTDKHKASVIEALRRAKFKFPGRQKVQQSVTIIFKLRVLTNLSMFLLQIFVSKKWGFTKWERPDYERLKAEGRLAPDGCNVRYRPEHGPLNEWKRVQEELAGVA